MWSVLGFVVAAAIGLLVTLIATRVGAIKLDEHPWRLPDTAQLHVGIMGGLAGFSFTGVVLIASLGRSQSSVVMASLGTVVLMFLVSYFYYIGNAFLISYLPHRDASGDLVPRVHFSLASTIEYRTLFVSWFALLPLLQAYGLDLPARVLSFLLPLSLLIGSTILAMAADGLGLVRLKETYLSAAVAAALALTYAAVVSFAAPEARSPNSTLYLTVAVFCVNAAGFGFAALTPLSPRYLGIQKFYERFGRRLVIADMQLTMASLAFLWLAVVGVI